MPILYTINYMKVKHLILDLDNTLYSSNGKMDHGITQRMNECVMELFKCSYDEAVKIRHERVTGFSTTLEWLQSEGLKDTEAFLAHVHPDEEADEVPEDPALRGLLMSIDIPKIICTNSPLEHAERVLKKLNVLDLIEKICDIRTFGFKGKPYASAYKTSLKEAGGTFEDTLFVDDMIKYTDGWTYLGGTAVLIGNKNGRPLSPDATALTINPEIKKGETIRINNIYELPEVISSLEKEKR